MSWDRSGEDHLQIMTGTCIAFGEHEYHLLASAMLISIESGEIKSLIMVDLRIIGLLQKNVRFLVSSDKISYLHSNQSAPPIRPCNCQCQDAPSYLQSS